MILQKQSQHPGYNSEIKEADLGIPQLAPLILINQNATNLVWFLHKTILFDHLLLLY